MSHRPPSPRNRSVVRVGVRVRPLTSKEIVQDGGISKPALSCHGNREIRLGTERRFTYDTVFDERTQQDELYRSVAPPLLESFIDGYNATIMAYGQTGSGKTFTMGSEAHADIRVSENTGLIPRFMNDLFDSLRRRQEAGSCKQAAEASSSQDGGDIPSSAAATTNALIDYSIEASFLEVYGEDVHDLLDPSRPSVPIREDANGGVVCSGLSQKPVRTAQAALQVLHEGTLNRTTAATLMNLTSSRSHAVFAVTLNQTTIGGDGVEVCATSRFTFVDLAGSERMKKTGAEGERAREGIKINEGLLALGNVINALADEEREGKKPHVPYRQSKLTRLLQDALGGNSQTLFLACVSPSTTNASETLSTLRYANRARNIKNAPVQNVDSTILELQKLRSWSSVLQSELLRLKFIPESTGGANKPMEDDLLQREDVREYLSKLNHVAQSTKTLSAVVPFLPEPNDSALALTPPTGQSDIQFEINSNDGHKKSSGNYGSSFEDVNPDDDMQILNHLLELQQRDQDFTETQKEDHEKIKEVDGILEKEQALLMKLRDSMKVYQELKDKYEMSMAQVRQLETEKSELSVKLGKVTKDPSQGCSKTIRRNMENVDRSLSRLRIEVQDHRRKCRLLDKEVEKCHDLERKIADLKADRAAMIKKQKEAGQRHREYTEAKQREITALKKKERKTTHKMSKLENEVEMQKKNLEKRQIYIEKLTGKLEETKSHLSKLLSVRKRDLQRTGGRRRLTMTMPVPQLTEESFYARSTEEVEDAIGFLRNSINDRVEKACLQNLYQKQIAEYSSTMRSMAEAVEKLRQSTKDNGPVEEDLQQNILDMELKAEILGNSLKELERQMVDDGDEQETKMRGWIESKDAPVLRSVMHEVLELYASSELQSREHADSLKQKVKTVESLEKEIDVLSNQIVKVPSPQDQESPNSVELTRLQASIDELSQQKNHYMTESVEAKEKLSLFEATASIQEQISVAEPILDELQTLLRGLGRDESNENLIDSIRNSVRDTIQRNLQEAKTESAKISEELKASIESVELLTMQLGLASVEVSSEGGLVDQLSKMKAVETDLRTQYNDALDQRASIKRALEKVMEDLGLGLQDVDQCFEELIRSSQSDIVTVSQSHLDKCEEHLSALRLRKSEILVTNSQRYEATKGMVKSAGLKANQVSSLVKRKMNSSPSWWNEELATDITNSLSSDSSAVQATEAYTQHISFIHTALQQTLSCRRDLSVALTRLVEHAQKKLLEAVDGESETVEAYSSFHEALFRLPEISRERISTFISEVEALSGCVEAMAISEVEALAVVWEALGISSSDRGIFWERMENLQREANAKSTEDFDKIVDNASLHGETWVLKSAKDAKTKSSLLESKLLKLDAVHKEVEKLRTKQGTKSNILSLDSEVRVLNAQLADFENRKCNKNRLLSRQTGSSHLLKEERYRKHMKAKFSFKMEQLAGLLKSWYDQEGAIFDASLLSDDVRLLLENSDQMSSWIEQRKEFMHLRTVKTDRKKRRYDSSSSTGSEESDPFSNIRPKRSKVSPSNEDLTARKRSKVSPTEEAARTSSRMVSAKADDVLSEQKRIRAKISPLSSMNRHTRTKRASPAPDNSSRPRKKIASSSLDRKSPVDEVPSLPPRSPVPKSNKRTTSTRATRASRSRRGVSPKPVFPIDLPGSVRESRASRSPSSSGNSISNTSGETETKPKLSRQGSHSRTPLSPKPSHSVNKQEHAGNANQPTKRITRSASAAAKKKLVLPPFANVLEKAFSPMDTSKEN